MGNAIVLFDFNGVFRYQDFYKSEKYRWVYASSMSGINGYCDSEARKLLLRDLEHMEQPVLSFIGSGNYHYVSLLLIQSIREDFTLVLFDHHSDMQKPFLSELLSCGSWLRTALEDLASLKQVVLVGVKEEALRLVPGKLPEGKLLTAFPEHALAENPDWLRRLGEVIRYPVYLSVDKDVLNPREASTDWDQGVMTMGQLSAAFREISSRQRILGMDVCGEFPPVFGEPFAVQAANRKNNRANEVLLRLWREAAPEQPEKAFHSGASRPAATSDDPPSEVSACRSLF